MLNADFPTRKLGTDNLGNQTDTLALNFSASSFDNKQITLTENLTTLTMTAGATAKSGYYLYVVGAGFTITWPANVKWLGAAKQPSASGTTVFHFVWDGTNFIEATT